MDKYYFKIKFINFNFQANLVAFFPSYSILTGQHITSPIIRSIKIIIIWNSDIRIKQETMMFKKLLQYLGQEFSVKGAPVYFA